MRTFRAVVNGNEYKVEIEELGVSEPGPARPAQPAAAAAARVKPAGTAAGQGAGDKKRVAAPMPGTVLKIGVNQGDKVTRGQMLLVLEAMKMENEIQAPEDGVVKEILTSQGAAVNGGDTLIVLD